MGKALDYTSLGRRLLVRYLTTDHLVVSRGKALDYISLGRGLGVGIGLHITGSWIKGKALDYRSLGCAIWVRHWTTDHWVMV